MPITILEKKIFSSNKIKPYIIAEIGSNFDQDFEKALKLINVARDAGADAVKFQLFKANHLYPNKDGLYKVFKSIELNPNWLSKLKNYAEKLNLDFIVSPFDKKSVDELDRVKLKIYKIASSEATNLDLINYIAKKRKPIIFSTGMCEMIDVEEAVGVIESYQNKLISILQCVSEYPLKISKTNLNVIELYKNRFSYPVGFSDHTLDSISAVTAVGLGARVFEKHITLDKNGIGPDHFYAMNPIEFKCYVKSIKSSFSSLGIKEKKLSVTERETGRREGIYSSTKIFKGKIIKDRDLIVKRPALGIRSRYKKILIGSKLKKTVNKNKPISWDLIE